MLRRWLALAALGLGLALAIPAAAQEEKEAGTVEDLVELAVDPRVDDRGFVTRFLENNLSGAGRQVTITGFQGALSSRATFETLSIADDDGVWITLHDGALQWNRSALFARRVEIEELSAARIELPRLPGGGETGARAEARSFRLPELPVSIDIREIRADRVEIGAPVVGEAAVVRVDGALTLAGGDGTAKLAIERVDGQRGVFAVDAGFSNATRVLRIDTTLDEEAGGIFANAVGLDGRPAVRATIKGEGPLEEFAADIALATDGQPRITGRVAANARAAEDGTPGTSFRLELQGDVASLLPEAQRPFFGASSVVVAEGWRGEDGRLSLPELRIDTEALDVTGQVATSADGRPASAQLQIALGESAGASTLPVRLPTTGKPTTVQDGRLSLTYDAAQGDGWTLDGTLRGFAQDDLTITEVSLDGAGTVVRDGAKIADIDGKVGFTVAGLAPADPDLARALGDSLTGATSFYWQPGQVAELTGLEIAGADYRLGGDLLADGLSSGITVSGELAGDYRDLSRLSGLAGRPLGGAAAIEVTGLLTLLTRGFDGEVRLTGTDVTTGQPQLDRLLAGGSTAFASLRRDETGIELREATVAAARLTGQAAGRISSTDTDLAATLRLASLADVDPALAGALEATARVTGAPGARRAAVDGIATDLLTGVAQLDGVLQGRTDLDAVLVERPAGWEIETFALENPQLQASGTGTLGAGTTDAALTFTLADLGAVQDGWAGRVRGEGRVTDTPEGRRLALTGTADGLRFGQAEADRVLAGTTRFDVAGLQAGERLTLERAEITGDGTEVRARGTLGGGATDLTLDARMDDLGRLGRGWRGSVDLAGTLTEAAGVRRFDLTGTGQDLRFGQAQADAALTGTTQLALRGTQGERGIEIEAGRLTNAQADITVQGKVGADGTDLAGTAKVASLAPLGLGWSGSLDLAGSFRDAGEGVRRLEVGGTGQDLSFGQANVDGALTGTTRLDLRATEQAGTFTIEAAELVNDVATIAATGTIGGGRTDAQAQVDVRRLEALGLGWRGSVQAQATLADDGSGARRFTVEGTANDLALGQAQVDAALSGPTRFVARGTERGGVVTFDEARADNARLSADVTGTVGGGETDLAGRVRADSLAFLGNGLRGAIDTTGRVRQTGAALSVQAQGTARDLGTGNEVADRLLAGTTRFDVDATRAGDDLRVARLVADNPQLRVEASGALASGLSVDARLADVGLLAPGFDGPATARGTVRQQGGGRLGVDLALTGPGGTTATVAGAVAQDGSTADLRIAGRTDAAVVNPLLRTRSVEGLLAFDLTLSGPPALESLRGRVSLEGGQLSDPKLGLRIDPLSLTADLDGTSARISGGGALSDGGRVAVEGTAALAAGGALDLAVTLTDAVLRDPNLYETSVSGTVRVTGRPADGPLVSGALALGRTEIRIPSTGLGGARDIPEITHLGERPPSRKTRAKAGLTPFPGAEATEAGLAGPPSTPPENPARLDLTISAPQQVFIRGRGVDAEMGGSLRLTGTARDVVPVGTFELIRGRVDLLGRRFELTEGLLELQGSLVPVIRLVAQTERDGITTTITIDGEARDPTITFGSIPDMPQEEVLSQLLFGRGLETISALQAAQLANAVATLAGRGGEGIVSRLRREVGLDDLDVGTDDEGNVTVRAGKYLSENVYTDLEVGGDGKTRLNINLDVTDDIRAKVGVDSEGDSSLGVFFERDY